MSNRPFGKSLPILGYACFVAALFLLVRGYQFNTNDQAEHLPQIYQMLDSELYPNDYFVNTTNSIFTVRHHYENLVLMVAKTIGLEWGLFILTFFCIALMAYSFARIAQELFANDWAVLLAPVLAMLVFYNFTVGGNHIMYGSFISSTIAKGIASYALLHFVRKNLIATGLVLGIATLLQPLVGLQLFLILSGIELLLRRKIKSTIVLTVSFVSIALFILIPIFSRQLAEGVPLNEEYYYEILYRFRNHHHYLPSLFPTTHYIKFGSLLLLGLASYLLVKPKDNQFYLGLAGFGLLGMLVYWVGLEQFHIYQLGKVQWFKITVWVGAFSSIMIAGSVGQILSGFIPINGFKRVLAPASIAFSVLILFGITNSKYLPKSYQHKYRIGNRVLWDLERLHFWIEENTEKDVSVLISPDNNAFPCQAKRSIPIHFQAIIHEPFFMLPWYDDYKEIYGVSIENLEGIDARKAAADKFLIRNYRGVRKHIDYRIDNIERCQFVNELGPVIHQEGSWVLTEFKPLNPN